MAILKIIIEGDPRLRQKALKIKRVDAGIRRLAEDMFETMIAAPGIGLAAPQVGVLLRMITVDVPEDYYEEGERGASLTLINPEIVKARDLDFREIRIRAEGMVARALQHEIDHLDGILFTDRVVDKSTLKYLPPTPEGQRSAQEKVLAE
jgi:peptide deformylase